MTVAAEQKEAVALFERVDDLESVAATLPAGDPRRDTLARIAAESLAQAKPLRATIAASLLQLNEKTVRAWMNEDVLIPVARQPRVLLDAGRVHQVLTLVRDLRAGGQTQGLLDAVYRALSDSALLEREDLRESLEQMARGEGTVVRRAAAS